jgi:hypothetical protein
LGSKGRERGPDLGMSLPPYPISFTGNFAVFLPYVAERRSPIHPKMLISLASPTGFEPLLPP